MAFFRSRAVGGRTRPGRADVVLGTGGVRDLPHPATKDRIAHWCRAEGYTYFTDSDGDVGGLWNHRVFYFFLVGDQQEVLQVRSYWQRVASIERLETILDLCNEWNADRVWPKAYVRVLDDGSVQVTCEMAADMEHGVTDAQLARLLACAVGTGTMFFNELDAHFPDPVGHAP